MRIYEKHLIYTLIKIHMLAKNKNKNEKRMIKIDHAEEAETAMALLLTSLSLGSIIVSGSIQPIIFSFFKDRQGSKKFTKTQWKNAYYNSKKRKLIEVVQMKDGRVKVKLTNKGVARTKDFSFENLKIRKPLRWDKKWRILIFDIPTKPTVYNQARNALRKKNKRSWLLSNAKKCLGVSIRM